MLLALLHVSADNMELANQVKELHLGPGVHIACSRASDISLKAITYLLQTMQISQLRSCGCFSLGLQEQHLTQQPVPCRTITEMNQEGIVHFDVGLNI